MAIKLVGTFIEVILRNNFGAFKVQNNEVGSSNVVITDLINIITKVIFYILFHRILGKPNTNLFLGIKR